MIITFQLLSPNILSYFPAPIQSQITQITAYRNINREQFISIFLLIIIWRINRRSFRGFPWPCEPCITSFSVTSYDLSFTVGVSLMIVHRRSKVAILVSYCFISWRSDLKLLVSAPYEGVREHTSHLSLAFQLKPDGSFFILSAGSQETPAGTLNDLSVASLTGRQMTFALH